MDAGWLKTYDGYYTEKEYHIMSTVVNRLSKHPDERYTIGDIAYFRRYYDSLLT